MSQNDSPTPNNDAPTPSQPTPPAGAAVPKARGKWRRRILKTIFGIVVAFIAFRIGIFLLLGFTLRKVANFYDLDLTYQRQEITMLGGDAGLWDVKVSRRGDTVPFLEAEYVHGNLSVLALLRTSIEIWRLEADGVLLDVTRKPDGSIPLLELVMAQLDNQPVQPKAATNEPLELGSPFKIDALRLHRLRARITDEAVQPAFRETLFADIRVSDLRNPDKPTLIEADIWSESILSALRFYGTGTAEGRVVRLDADFRGAGLNLGPVAAYLQPHGLNPVARSIDWTGKISLATDEGPTPTTVRATIDIKDLSAVADAAAVASVNHIAIAAKSAGAEGVALSDVKVDGVEVRADRSREGRLRFAGIELVTPPTTRPTAKAVQLSRPVAPTTGPAGKPFSLTLDAFSLTNLEAALGDAYLDQPAVLSVHVDELKTTQIIRDASGRVVVPLTGTLRAPGIAEAIAIDGSIQPFEAPYEFSARLSASRITPKALAPYLELLGLSSTLKDATLDGSLLARAEPTQTGGVEASVKLVDLLIKDAGTRVAMPLLRADGVRFEPTQSSIVIREAEIVGPELAASREADGAVEGVGLRYEPAEPVSQVAAPPTTRPATRLVELPVLPALPRIEVGSLKWSGTKIELTDNAVAPARTFSLTDVGANLHNLVIDLSPRAGESNNGTIDGWLSLPGMVNRFAVKGTFERVPNRTSIRVGIIGEGLSTAELAPYLAPLNIEPQLDDARLALDLGVDLVLVNQALGVNLNVTDLSLREKERELAALKTLTVDRLAVVDGAVAAESVRVDGVTVSAARLADGSLASTGVRLLPAKPAPATLAAPGPLLPIPYSPVPIRVGELKATNIQARWRDDAAREPVQLTLRAAADMSNVALSLPGEPARFEASGSIDGIARSFSARGLLDVDPAAVVFEGELRAQGVTGSAIDGYLPAGSKTTLEDASLAAKVRTRLTPVSDTAQAIEVFLSDLTLREGDVMLATVPGVTLDVPQIDLDQNVIDIRSLVVDRAAVANVRVLADGTIALPGLELGPPPADVAPPAEAPIVVTADAIGPGDEVDLAARLAAARKPLPRVTIETLDLGVAQAGLELEARAGAVPVELRSLRVTNVGPVSIGGAGAAELPPVKLQITTGLAPLVKNVKLDVEAAPFAAEATLLATLAAEGINGGGLLELAPELAALVDGSNLTDGRLQASVEGRLRLARRTPTDIDLRRGFEAELRVADVQYRTAPEAEAVAGVESIMMEGVRVMPAFAGGTVKTLTVNKPMARVLRDAQGVHLLGWTIKLPAPGEASATQPTTEPSEAPPPPASVAVQAPTPTVPAAPGPEFRIEKLLVSGGDVLIRDIAVEPPLVVPINALDVEVKGLSSRALVEDRTIRFSALVGADKVELPTRARRGQAASGATELRPLLSQVTATGNLKLYPVTEGYVKAAVNGFEMQSLIGEAKQFNITVGDGIFDGTFDARFREGGNLDLKSRLVVTDLKLSEQPNGLMQRKLNLPVPVDAAIGMVEDASGSISLPVSVKLRRGEIDMGSIIGSVIGGVSEIVVKAIASAPLKALQGLGGEKQPAEPRPPVVLTFLPGDISLEPALRRQLDELIALLRKDGNVSVTLSHRLSEPDANRARDLASPTTEQITQMTGALRQQRLTLMNDRAVAAADLAADIASGRSGDESLLAVRELDRRIVANDDALERLLDLTRPGAELQSERRMKAAAIDIASARLSQVRAYLDAARLDRAAERISVVNPRFEIEDTIQGGGLVSIELIERKRAQ